MRVTWRRSTGGRARPRLPFPAFAAAMGLIVGVALTGLAVPYVRSKPVVTQVASTGGTTPGAAPGAVVDPSTGATVPGNGGGTATPNGVGGGSVPTGTTGGTGVGPARARAARPPAAPRTSG